MPAACLTVTLTPLPEPLTPALGVSKVLTTVSIFWSMEPVTLTSPFKVSIAAALALTF